MVMSIAEDVLDFLFDGAMPVEEIMKVNDASEVHVPGPLKQKKKSWDEKTTAQKVGVATSYGGAAAGPAAIYMAVKGAKEGKGGMPRDIARSIGGKRGKRVAAYLDSPKSRTAKVAAGLAGAGIVGLQTANWVGDAVNSRELTKPRMAEEATIKKMIRDAVMAGIPGEEVMEMIEKAGSVSQATKMIRTGQRTLGALVASGVAGGGYLVGRKQTDKEVDEALDERGIPQRVVPVAPSPAAAAVAKPKKVLKPLKTDVMPTVIHSDYAAKKVPLPEKAKEKITKTIHIDTERMKAVDAQARKNVGPIPKNAPVNVNGYPKVLDKEVRRLYKEQGAISLKKNDDWVWEGEISKVDQEKQHVFGWCSIAKVNGEPVIDRQDDYIPVEEMEKSAYDYVLHSRKGGDMHQRDGEHPLHKSDMIESFVVTPEKLEKMGIDPDTVPHGWWVGFKVNDDQLWNEVKDGKKTYFSVHGRGRRVKEYV